MQIKSLVEPSLKDLFNMVEPSKDKVNQCAFEVDGRVRVLLDHDLAVSLGSLILSTDTKTSAILALGHQLRNFSKVKAPADQEPT